MLELKLPLAAFLYLAGPIPALPRALEQLCLSFPVHHSQQGAGQQQEEEVELNPLYLPISSGPPSAATRRRAAPTAR